MNCLIPINEKYGDDRFSFLLKLYPLEYKNLIPNDKYIKNDNPPKTIIEF